jgi:ribosome maturation factor RimP
MNGQALNEIRRRVEEVTAREGCYLYDIEFVGGGNGRILRVYIEKDSEGGVSIEDCSKVSRGLNELLDAEEEVIPGGAYDLEVSSPGLERVLKEPRHYERVIGQKILVRTFAPIAQFNEKFAEELGKAKQVQGPLLSFDQLGLKVDSDGKEVFIPFETVTKAHVVFEFTESPEGKLKPGQKGNQKKVPGKRENSKK